MKYRALAPPTQALCRSIVLSNIHTSPPTTLLRTLHTTTFRMTTPTPLTPPTCLSPFRPLRQRRHFSSSNAHLAVNRPPEKRAQLWDDEIPALRVQLVDEETEKLEPEPRPLRLVLNDYDHKTHRLVLITPVPAGHIDPRRKTPPHKQRGRRHRGQEDGEEEEKTADQLAAQRERERVSAAWTPICKIQSKKKMYQQEQAKKIAKKTKGESKKAAKTLSLTWQIGGGDLAHKMKELEQKLGEGRDVEVVIWHKKGASKKAVKVTAEECEKVMARVVATFEGVPGTRERKARTGEPGKMMSFFLSGQGKKTEEQVKEEMIGELEDEMAGCERRANKFRELQLSCEEEANGEEDPGKKAQILARRDEFVVRYKEQERKRGEIEERINRLSST